ncbi:MAG: hypothetical protein MJ074_06485 [Oscillospiraceae bacterium]|nr:hypothetical protein [Oscillospiraceae bacterium]
MAISCDGEWHSMEVCDTFENVVRRAKETARSYGWQHGASIAVSLNGRNVWGAGAYGRGASFRESYNAVQGVERGTIEHLALYVGGERVETAPRGAHLVLGCYRGCGLYALDGKFYIAGL